jgi:DNA polymerase III sliding clamp (beta) subunit (PCNA family)
MYTVNAKLFEIAHRFASKEETRYYLGGVCIEPAPYQGGVLLIATDGHRMMVLHDADAKAPPAPVIMQASALALKACREKSAERIIYNDTSGEVVTDEGQSLAGGFSFIDGCFPDWRRVVPQTLPESGAAFNAKYVGDFMKAATDLAKLSGLRSGAAQFHCDPAGAAVVCFSNSPGFGVIMPLRAETTRSESVFDSIRQTGEAIAIAAE